MKLTHWAVVCLLSGGFGVEAGAQPAGRQDRKSKEVRAAGREARKEARAARKEARKEGREARKEEREELKEARKEAREAREEVREARQDDRAALEALKAATRKSWKERHAEIKAGWKKRLRELKSIAKQGPDGAEALAKTRAARRAGRRLQIMARWGRLHTRKPAFLELKSHSWRMARLHRMYILSSAKDNAKALERLDKLVDLELERHAKAMEKLFAAFGPEAESAGDPQKGGAEKQPKAGGNK